MLDVVLIYLVAFLVTPVEMLSFCYTSGCSNMLAAVASRLIRGIRSPLADLISLLLH